MKHLKKKLDQRITIIIGATVVIIFAIYLLSSSLQKSNGLITGAGTSDKNPQKIAGNITTNVGGEGL